MRFEEGKRAKGATFLDLALLWTDCETLGNSRVQPFLFYGFLICHEKAPIPAPSLCSCGTSIHSSCAPSHSKCLSPEVLKEVIKDQFKYQQPCFL